MRIAYLDCFSGVAGDMFVGALIHAGLDVKALEAELARLGNLGFRLHVEKVWRDAMEGVRFEVLVEPGATQPERHLSDVKNIIAGSGLDPQIKASAIAVFTRLAEAEAKVHGTTVEEVHFHEVGALDAIVDVVGAVAGLRLLGVDQVYCSRVTVGRGTQTAAHGVMPVPVPASIELLRGAPVVFSELEGELVTPTGAALVSTLTHRFGAAFSLVPSSVGYGFGKRERPGGPPNALRVVVGEADEAAESLVVLETNLDDVSGQVVGFLIDRVLAAGALDAWATPIQMKKSRPGILFSALVGESERDAVERVIWQETPTLGVRRHGVGRTRLERKIEVVRTELGDVRVKFARGAGVSRAAPEFEDVARIAAERGMPFRACLDAIQREIPNWID